MEVVVAGKIELVVVLVVVVIVAVDMPG